MSESLFSGLGVFDHVPTPEEVEAKAFVMPRRLQNGGFWGAYACGLADAGVDPSLVMQIVMAACNGEFAHNVEPMFYGELEDEVCDE